MKLKKQKDADYVYHMHLNIQNQLSETDQAKKQIYNDKYGGMRSDYIYE